MGIEYTVTPAATTGRAKLYDSQGNGFSLEAVIAPPDFASQIDTVEDEILENLESGNAVNIKDLAVAIVGKAKREIMGEILLRLLCILSESDNVKLDVEILISAAGLPLRDEPDSTIAARYGIMRQTFSARKKALMRRLGMNPPPHSKTLTAVESYRHSNRRNGSIQQN